MSNPVFNEANFNKRLAEAAPQRVNNAVMTMQGTVNKSFILLAVLIAAAAFAWTHPQYWNLFLWPSLIAGFVVAMVISFKPAAAPYLSWLYAALEGLVLGAISFAFEAQYAGIISQAIVLTLAVFLGILFLYKTGIIKVTRGFYKFIMIAMFGIIIFYLLSFGMMLFGKTSFVYANTAAGIIFSVAVCIIAALSLALDFEFISKMSASNAAPKYFEWYGAFGLMVTLVWLYLEILRLLAKSKSRN